MSMNIERSSLEINEYGRFSPLVLVGNPPNKWGVLTDLASTCRHGNILAFYATSPEMITRVSSSADGLEQLVMGDALRLRLMPYMQDTIGDDPAILIIRGVGQQDTATLQRLMDVLKTGDAGSGYTLGKQVMIVIAEDFKRDIRDPQAWAEFVEHHSQVYEFGVNPPKPMIAIGTPMTEREIAPSVFAEYVDAANQISRINEARYSDEIAAMLGSLPQQNAQDYREGLEKLSSLVSVLGELDGGLYGKQAFDRGVDEGLITALRRVSETAERSSTSNLRPDIMEFVGALNKVLYVEPQSVDLQIRRVPTIEREAKSNSPELNL